MPPLLISRRAGFTYIELMVTLAILSLLAAVALPFAELTVQRDKEAQLQQALLSIRQAIDAYKQAVTNGQIAVQQSNGQCSSTGPGGRCLPASGYPPNLDILVSGVPNAQAPNTQLYFLRRVPADPFAANPALPASQTWGLRSYASEPTAPAPGDDVYDVYSQSTAKGLNDVPYKEW